MNPTLARIFGSDWKHVRSTVTDDKELQMAHDICRILEISNVSLAIKSTKGTSNVSPQHRTM